MENLSGLLNPILGFLLTLAFGFWLSRRGKPYNGLLFNVHKLIALATMVLLVLAVHRALNGMELVNSIVVLLVLAALSVIALFVSGALMSASKGEYRTMKLIHNISPFIAVLAMGSTLHLL